MTPLHKLHCSNCQADTPPLDDQKASELLYQLPGWHLENDDGVRKLSRRYSFQDFKQAFAFATLITDLAEQQNHHPALLIEWGSVTVLWWTHSIAGLHKNDFIMAAKTELIATTSTQGSNDKR